MKRKDSCRQGNNQGKEDQDGTAAQRRNNLNIAEKRSLIREDEFKERIVKEKELKQTQEIQSTSSPNLT